jgi:hypothetical protein
MFAVIAVSTLVPALRAVRFDSSLLLRGDV